MNRDECECPEGGCTFGCPQEDAGDDLSTSEDSGLPYYDAEGNSGTRVVTPFASRRRWCKNLPRPKKRPAA